MTCDTEPARVELQTVVKSGQCLMVLHVCSFQRMGQTDLTAGRRNEERVKVKVADKGRRQWGGCETVWELLGLEEVWHVSFTWHPPCAQPSPWWPAFLLPLGRVPFHKCHHRGVWLPLAAKQQQIWLLLRWWRWDMTFEGQSEENNNFHAFLSWASVLALQSFHYTSVTFLHSLSPNLSSPTSAPGLSRSEPFDIAFLSLTPLSSLQHQPLTSLQFLLEQLPRSLSARPPPLYCPLKLHLFGDRLQKQQWLLQGKKS